MRPLSLLSPPAHPPSSGACLISSFTVSWNIYPAQVLMHMHVTAYFCFHQLVKSPRAQSSNSFQEHLRFFVPGISVWKRFKSAYNLTYGFTNFHKVNISTKTTRCYQKQVIRNYTTTNVQRNNLWSNQRNYSEAITEAEEKLLKKITKLSLFLRVMWSLYVTNIFYLSETHTVVIFSILVNYFKVTWSRDVRGSRKWRKFLMWAFKLRKTYIFVSTTSALYTVTQILN